jgi:DNA-binding NarL/FixJ family response regulator
MTAGSGNSDGRLRVALIDDQLLFREALGAVLEDSGSIAVVHSSRHGGQDIRSLLDTPASVLLVALDAQANDAMATVREARLFAPALPVCALVGPDRLERAREAIAAGCKGAVSTSASLGLLVSALENLARGQDFVDPSLAGKLLAKSLARTGTGRSPRNGSRHGNGSVSRLPGPGPADN